MTVFRALLAKSGLGNHDERVPLPLLDLQHPGNAVYAVICAAVLAILYFVMRPRKNKKDPLEYSPKFSLAQQRQVEQQMQNLLVEFAEMARQMSAQLDTRAAKLELLIKEADEKLAAMKEATGTDSPRQTEQPIVTLGETGHSENGQSQGGTSNNSANGSSNTMPGESGASRVDARHAEIYALADQGLSARDIARRLNRTNGEIELILALRSSAHRG